VNIRELVRWRLAAQQISTPRSADAADVVSELGAIQAQDWPAAQWAVALRTTGGTKQTLDQAIETARVVRTWPMRGTLHLVAAKDVRWMLQLLTPRPIAAMRGRLRQLELTDADLERGREAICTALAGRRALTRADLYGVLASAGVDPVGQRGIHILGWLAHHAVVCHGPPNGKQPTFVLLDEWVAPQPDIDCDEALRRLATRYFTGHGPATVHDLAWWSGLAAGDVRRAISAAGDGMLRLRVGDIEYLATSEPAGYPRKTRVQLLPAFDEYLLGYRDRSAMLAPADARHVVQGGMFLPLIVDAGRVVGRWRRALGKADVGVELEWFGSASDRVRAAAASAARRYARYLGLPLRLSWSSAQQ
jgi:hypothetical protein